ncbi:uncharacterized protein [Penaeus vannamei]|uniref:uncharacterized protein n=1 Tax=Penaeus vannamei TaxID=6689 RepID=UPI00387F7B22
MASNEDVIPILEVMRHAPSSNSPTNSISPGSPTPGSPLTTTLNTTTTAHSSMPTRALPTQAETQSPEDILTLPISSPLALQPSSNTPSSLIITLQPYSPSLRNITPRSNTPSSTCPHLSTTNNPTDILPMDIDWSDSGEYLLGCLKDRDVISVHFYSIPPRGHRKKPTNIAKITVNCPAQTRTCANCGGPNKVFYRSCPTYKFESEVATQTQKLSHSTPNTAPSCSLHTQSDCRYPYPSYTYCPYTPPSQHNSSSYSYPPYTTPSYSLPIRPDRSRPVTIASESLSSCNIYPVQCYTIPPRGHRKLHANIAGRLILPRLPSVHMTFSIRNRTKSDHIDLRANARNVGVSATLQSTVAPCLDALYVPNLVMAVQTVMYQV